MENTTIRNKNSVKLYGSIYKLPQFSETKTGMMVCKFAICFKTNSYEVSTIDCIAYGMYAQEIKKYADYLTWEDEAMVSGKLKVAKLYNKYYPHLEITLSDFALCKCKALNEKGYNMDTYYKVIPFGKKNKVSSKEIDKNTNEFILDCMIFEDEMPTSDETKNGAFAYVNWNKSGVRDDYFFTTKGREEFDYTCKATYGESIRITEQMKNNTSRYGYFRIKGKFTGKEAESQKHTLYYTTYLQIEEIYHIKNEHVEEVPIIYNIPHVMGAYDDFVENHGYDTYEEYAEFTPIF